MKSKAEKISDTIGKLNEKTVTKVDKKIEKKVFVYAETLAQTDYPESTEYPKENDFFFSVLGQFKDEISEKNYNLWEEEGNARREAGKILSESGNIKEFYKNSINTILSDTDNTIYSPVNLYMVLAILAETTESETRTEILNLLGVNDIQELRNQTENMWNANYRNDGATVSILANSLWLNEGISYKKETVERLAKKYYSSVYRGDLTSEKMQEALHQWLNQQTNGLLKDSVKRLSFGEDPVAMICSTLNFHANWNDQFNQDKNDYKIFHNTNGDKETEFMNSTIEYGPYFWNEDYAAVHLHFGDSGTMWFILPDENKRVEQILEKGEYLDMITSPNDWKDKVVIKVNLSVPKFDVSSDLMLKDDLKKLGVKSVFDIENSDFSELTNDKDVYISNVQHSTRVKIDEEGCTAVAFAAMFMMAGLPLEDEVDFVIDREFMFVIMSDTYQPLFVGVVGDVE